VKIGLTLGYTPAHVTQAMQIVLEAERLGFDSVWTSEAYGSDAVTPAAYLLARTTRIKVGTGIMQMPARTPTCAAMTALTMNLLSGGRFILGIGPSGPQVIEGWHGVAYGKPLVRTREYIDIVRAILARREPLSYAGEIYQVPYHGPGSSGLGKPLKSIMPAAPEIPIYTAAVSPGGLRIAAQVADGVIPLWMDPERFDLIATPLQEGFARAATPKSLANFAIAPFVPVALDENPVAARNALRDHFALYIGGMGARDKNFYNDYARRLGYEEQARRIQDLYLGGRKAEAAAAVPDALIDACALAGPAARIRDRLEAWRAAAGRREVDTLIASVYHGGAAALGVLAQALR
jgi:F420-dependent oxidoreductase-like protein